MRHRNLQNWSARDIECRTTATEKHRKPSSFTEKGYDHNISGRKPTLTDVGSRTVQGMNSDMFLQVPWHTAIFWQNGFKWHKNAHRQAASEFPNANVHLWSARQGGLGVHNPGGL